MELSLGYKTLWVRHQEEGLAARAATSEMCLALYSEVCRDQRTMNHPLPCPALTSAMVCRHHLQ